MTEVNYSDTLERVKKAIRKALNDEDLIVNEQDTLINLCGEPMYLLSIKDEVEQEFNLRILSNEQITKLTSNQKERNRITVKDVANRVMGKKMYVQEGHA